MTRRQTVQQILLISLVSMTAGLSFFAAHAQSSSPASEPSTSAVSGRAPDSTLPQAEHPATELNRKLMEPPPSSAANAMLGLSVFGSDGQRVGKVADVKPGSNGKVAEIHIRTDGFFGFWTRVVSVPSGKFAKPGPYVELSLTSDEVDKLPEVRPHPS
jgi:PRC-barrel domain